MLAVAQILNDMLKIVNKILLTKINGAPVENKE